MQPNDEATPTKEEKPANAPEKAADENTKKSDESSHANHHNDKRPIIIIKKIKKVHNKHHGGSWKIAYADFVTAMMTFFLLMWLLSMLNKYQLEGISQYFKTPLKVVQGGGGAKQASDKKMTKEEAKKKMEDDMKTEEKRRQESEIMKRDLENQLKNDPKLSQYKNALNFVVTAEGLKIELKDLENKPMFSTGKTDFDKYAKDLLNWLGPSINKYPNRLMIIGHTDGKPFNGANGYTNWELSADRANATRRALIDSGMNPEKVARVVGTADVDKLDTAKDNLDPANRRIVMIILTDEAFQRLQDQ